MALLHFSAATLEALIGVTLVSCTTPNPNYHRRDAAADALTDGNNHGDTAHPDCDPSKPFGVPALVPGVNSSIDEQGFTTTRDGLTGFVSLYLPTDPQGIRISMTKRSTRTDDFSAPQQGAAAAINATTGDESFPSPVADGLLLYYQRQNGARLSFFVASRLDSQSAYGSETEISVGSTVLQPALLPRISSDGQTLYWLDFHALTLQAATRGITAWLFENQRAMSTMQVNSFALSEDEMTLYYADANADDMFVTSRSNTSTPFAPGTRLDALNSAQSDAPLFLSHDGCILYFASKRAGGLGGYDVWQAPRQ